MDPTAYYDNRCKMITELKKDPKTYPYPHKFHVQYSLAQFIEKYDPLCKAEQWLDEQVAVAARITTIRKQGKLIFYDLHQEGKKLQVMCNAQNHKVERDFDELHSTIRRGDVVGVIGRPGRTKSNELSIAPGEFKLLSPCLQMLPDPKTGLKDR